MVKKYVTWGLLNFRKLLKHSSAQVHSIPRYACLSLALSVCLPVCLYCTLYRAFLDMYCTGCDLCTLKFTVLQYFVYYVCWALLSVRYITSMHIHVLYKAIACVHFTKNSCSVGIYASNQILLSRHSKENSGIFSFFLIFMILNLFSFY